MNAQKKIRVLEMIDDADVGGGQIHLLLLAKYLPKDRFEVAIACAENGFLVDEAGKLQIRHFPIDISNRLRWDSYDQLQHMFREHRFDIIHTHGGTAGFWGRTVARLSRSSACVIHTYHGIHYLGQRRTVPSWYRHIDAMLLRWTDRCICVCRADYEAGVQAGIVDPNRADIIPNGIEISRFQHLPDRNASRSKYHIGPETFIFGNIGRLHPQKGQTDLLRAFDSIQHEIPKSELWIIGEGELRSELERRIRQLGLDGKVRLLGSRTDIPELLSVIDVVVLPSLWEGQPISLLEAMAAGKPVIASNVDGTAEILRDGENALAVPPRNATELSSAMVRLYADQSLRELIGIAAQQTISGGYSVDRMVGQIARLYEHAYSQRNRTS